MKFTHALVCDNQSAAAVQFCLYQRFQKPSAAVSLAWLCQICSPQAKTVFRWSEELHFVWGYARSLEPGDNVFTVQAAPLQDGEQARLLWQPSGSYAFQSAPAASPLIQTDASLPAGLVAVGLGMQAECMCDTAALMVAAGPNGRYAFDTEIEYHLAWSPACKLQNGDVLDINGLSSQRVVFPFGCRQLIAQLDETNRVTLAPPLLRSTRLL